MQNLLLALAQLFGIVAASIIWRSYKGKPALWPSFPNAIFSERWRSGAYCKWGLLSRLGGARNCLWVAVTDGEFRVGPMFPFSLFFISEFWGFDLRIRGEDILEVDMRPSVFNGMGAGRRVRILFQKPNGGTQRFEVWVKDLGGFQHAISQITDDPLAADVDREIAEPLGRRLIPLVVFIAVFQVVAISLFGFIYVKERWFGGSADHLPPNQQAAVESLKSVGAWIKIPDEVTSVNLSSSSKFGSNRVSDADLNHLKEFPNLKQLDLGGCKAITDDGMKEVGQLKKLETLSLLRTNITDRGIAHLADLVELENLGFAETSITDAAFQHFDKMKNLTGLGLAGCTQITGDGLRHLSSLEKLTGISAGDTSFNDAALQKLAGSTTLEYLYLSNTLITDDGLQHLGRLIKLERIYLNGTAVTSEGKRRLRDKLKQNGHHGHIVGL